MSISSLLITKEQCGIRVISMNIGYIVACQGLLYVLDLPVGVVINCTKMKYFKD